MRKKNLISGICVVLAVALAKPATAAFVPWTNPTGSNGVVTWASGGSTDSLWGDPTITSSGGIDTTFTFHPDEFRAESSNGVAVTTDGLLRFNLDILPFANGTPRGFQQIAMTESGSYSILGIGSVQATGLMIVNDRDSSNVYTNAMTSTPVFPVSVSTPFGSASGGWTGSMTVLANGETQITITIDNTLQATSVAAGPGIPGSTSYIDKKLAGGVVSLEVIAPEPSTLGLLLCGVPLLLKRRRS